MKPEISPQQRIPFNTYLGRPLRIDSHNVNRVKLGTASVSVELDVSKPLLNETWVSFVNDEDPSIVDGFWQKVEYDDVPPYCSKCFHLGHKNDYCKRDLEKEQGLKPPYVQRRRQYRRVVNPTQPVPNNSVIDGKKKGVMNHVPSNNGASTSGTKDSDEVAQVRLKVVPITNLFTGLECINHEEKREYGEIWEDPFEARGESSRPETTLHGAMVIAGKLKVPNLDGFQALSQDFHEDMGAFCKEFSAPSASTSPRVSSIAREHGDVGLMMAEEDIAGQLAEKLQQVYKDSLEDVGVDIVPHDANISILSQLDKDIAACDEPRAVVTTEKAVLGDHRQYLQLKLTHLPTAKMYYITVVYVVCNIPERRVLLDALFNLQNISTPWMVMGDFNALVSGDERIRGNSPDPLSMSDFSQCIQDCHLLDVGFVGSKYTWTNGKLSQRLERVLSD
ncbi:hypothetical protein LIER_43298 [Lithospermum erythrorhizon]|uniref:Endonuclease/exonuclease/phosphatase domain-containing protein n=1 Tax=Lithospermum erythrorhizon TaxID=34254 RepID=A0AAV3PUY8_LITER